MSTAQLRPRQHRGVIFDLDGVLTDTAEPHAHAWKQLFDEYLSQRSERPDEEHRPFTMEDYRRYVDGKSRSDGVESFLTSRGIELPGGEQSDASGHETISGLGNRKNEYFHERLEHEGVRVFDDALSLIKRLQELDVPTAIISASRNAERVLESAGLHHLFDVRVDGVVADELGLQGKPDPAILLEAAARLEVAAADAVVVEDARAGVEAGRRGGFALVIGVDRGQGGGLAEAGADVVVADLSEVEIVPSVREDREDSNPGQIRNVRDVPDALEHWASVVEAMGDRRPALFLDFDGTLTPIVEHPGDVRLPDDAAAALRRVAELTTVAVVSGRDLRDVRRHVGVDSIWYAGSHGFEIGGPTGEHHEVEAAADALPQLDQAERDIGSLVEDIPGAEVDRKRFSIATHYRNVPEERIDDVIAAADEVAERLGLRSSDGRRVVEVQPDVDWHKGRAVDFLMNELELDDDQVVPVFVGDGSTDEDAFETIEERGIGIVVRHDERSRPSTSAIFAVEGPEALPALLDHFAEMLTTTEGSR